MPDENLTPPPGTEPIDHSFIDDLVEIALSDRPSSGLADFSRAELADMYVRASELAGLLSTAKSKLAAELALVLDTPMLLPNGWIIKPTRTARRVGWHTEELIARLTEYCTRWLVDPESGEKVAALDPRRVSAVFEPAKGRTRNLVAAGIKVSELCTEEWTDTIEVIR